MDLTVILGVVGVVGFVFLIVLIRLLIYACLYACMEKLCTCCFIICCGTKKDQADSASVQSEEALEESPDFVIFSTQPASTKSYNNNNNEYNYLHDPNQQKLNQNWAGYNNNPTSVQYQFNQKGVNRFQLSSPTRLNSHEQMSNMDRYGTQENPQQNFSFNQQNYKQGTSMDPNGNQFIQENPQQNFSFNQQNYNNNYGQGKSNPNYQHQFYAGQSHTPRLSNGYYQSNQSVFVIPDQHSVNPLYMHKN